MEWLLQLNIIVQTAVAMLLGGLVGIEREMSDKAAGLRTHMLVAGASALLIRLSTLLLQYFDQVNNITTIRSDPIRIIQAIVLGISFLGAGTIIRRGEQERIEGLTTAASIMISAAIGICVGIQKIGLALGIAILTVIVLNLLRFVERWIGSKKVSVRSRKDK